MSRRPLEQQDWFISLCGAGMMFLGYCLFQYLTSLENGTAQPRSVPILFAALYKIGGRWGASIAVELLGAFAIYRGIVGMANRTHSPEDDGAKKS